MGFLALCFVGVACTQAVAPEEEVASEQSKLNLPALGYLGCFTDSASRALPIQLMNQGATIESCIAAAHTAGLPYAGVQAGGQCFAGNAPGFQKVADAQCNQPCSASTSETCGGQWLNSIYPTGVTAQGYQGCYTDSATRALPSQLMAQGATVETCIAAARQAGFTYAGVQDGGQCFAGNTLGSQKVADAQCNDSCSANPSETCGGVWLNSVYATGYQGCFTDSASRALPTQLMGQGATVESCIAAARQAGYAYAGVQAAGQCFAGNAPGNQKVADAQCNQRCTANASETCGGQWLNSIYATGSATASFPPGYQGCFTDSPARALPTQLASQNATVESCVAAAKQAGLAYAGVQAAGQCFGGNALGNQRVADSQCNQTCTANASETCGGQWLNSIYATGATATTPPPTCRTCASAGVTCGTISDGCGGTLNCGGPKTFCFECDIYVTYYDDNGDPYQVLQSAPHTLSATGCTAAAASATLTGTKTLGCAFVGTSPTTCH